MGKRGDRAAPVCKRANTYFDTMAIGARNLACHIGVAVVFNKF